MHKIILFFCLVVCFFHKGLGQEINVDSLRAGYDQSYGLDALLTNGKKYFPPGKPVTGHPFWKSENAFLSMITVSGHTFTNQLVKYDLNMQQFVLFYNNYNGQPGQIILNNSLIDSVNIGNCVFIPTTSPQIHQPFVQLISKGNLTCTISWNKELNLNTMVFPATYEYTKELSCNYLTYKGSDYRFNNKSTFLRIFNSKERAPIRKYLSSHHLKFKKMNDNDLGKLIRFCEQNLN